MLVDSWCSDEECDLYSLPGKLLNGGLHRAVHVALDLPGVPQSQRVIRKVCQKPSVHALQSHKFIFSWVLMRFCRAKCSGKVGTFHCFPVRIHFIPPCEDRSRWLPYKRSLIRIDLMGLLFCTPATILIKILTAGIYYAWQITTTKMGFASSWRG